MRVRIEHKVTSTKTAEVALLGVIAGCVVGAFLGPGAGILAAVAGFAGGYPAAKQEAEGEADRLIDNKIPHGFLQDAMKDGRGKIIVKTELKNFHPDVPLPGRLLIGDRLTKETTYYFDE